MVDLPYIKKEDIGPEIRSYLRVLKLTKRPSTDEFLMIAKVAGIGIVAVGAIGFLVYILMVMVPKLLVAH